MDASERALKIHQKLIDFFGYPDWRNPLPPLDELVSNMVRHQPGGGPEIELALELSGTHLTLRLVDHGVDPFDPASAPAPDLEAPPQERTEGGLGIYLTRQLMSDLRYEYDAGRRSSTITMVKVLEA